MRRVTQTRSCFRRDQETLQALSRAGFAKQPAVHAHAHHLGPVLALGVQHVEGVDQVLRKILPVGETRSRREFHVVGVERIGHDELPFDGSIGHRDWQVERQVIAIVIAVVFKTTVLKHEAFGIRTVTTGVPAKRPLPAGQFTNDARGLGDLAAFFTFRHVLVMNPAQAVRGNFVAEFAERGRRFADAAAVPPLRRRRSMAGCVSRIRAGCARGHARTVLVHRLHRQMARLEGGSTIDFRQEGLGRRVAVQNTQFSAPLRSSARS